MTELWLPPEGVRRASDVITVSAGMFKSRAFRCPAADALKARGYRPSRPASAPKERLQHFALGPFMAARDARTRGTDNSAARNRTRPAPPHAGLRTWTEHALARYEAAFPDDQDRKLTEVPDPWTYRYQPSGTDPRAASEYQLKVWGRCLWSADGPARELRLPVHRLRPEPPPEGFIAAAALVLAEGTPGPVPERVRIVEFALLDGQVRSLFDNTRAEAVAYYREHGRRALSAVLDSQEYRPGANCAECPFLSVCPALRTAPGLLGVEAADRPRRTWSVTNGRNYRICPARDHMRRLHLPTADGVERDPTAERGRALHAFLAERHNHSAPRPCTAEVPEHWVPKGFVLPEGERALGERLLRAHAAICPLHYVRDSTDVRTEPRIVRHDSVADVVVLAAPDLLYRDEGSWVWRETKSSAHTRRPNRSLFQLYPQLALAALFVARGDLGGKPTRARVELEVLRPRGADLEIIDPFAPATRLSAERTVHELVAGWHSDDSYPPSPGHRCSRCEVARWCPSSPTGDEAS